MSLPVNNKNNSKVGNKGHNNAQGSKFIVKPNTGKAIGAAKKPIKTGGSRGS
jgi:hypothetical protein